MLRIIKIWCGFNYHVTQRVLAELARESLLWVFLLPFLCLRVIWNDDYDHHADGYKASALHSELGNLYLYKNTFDQTIFWHRINNCLHVWGNSHCYNVNTIHFLDLWLLHMSILVLSTPPKKAIPLTCFFWGVDSTKIDFSTMYPPTYWKISGGVDTTVKKLTW